MTLTRLACLGGLALALALLLREPAVAQCAMCRTALEQNGEIAGGFNRGILFLLGMPYLVFAAIGTAWYWKRRQAARREELRPRDGFGTWRRVPSPSPGLES